MTPNEKAYHIVSNLMLGNDAFSQWIHLELVEIGLGECILKSTITKEMTNGFGICHGGITYSIADSALAFASNSHGIQAVSIETSISHTKPVQIDDIITAKAVEKHLSKKLGIYEVTLTNQNNQICALFKGTVFRTEKEWEW